MTSPWKGLEKFLQGDWAECSLWTVIGIWSCVDSFHLGRKAPVTICSCLKVKRDQNSCLRIYEHKKLNSKIALHLLKICHVSDTIHYLLSLQKSQKADTGIFSLQKRTLKFKESHILPEATLLSSFKVRNCIHDPIWFPSLFYSSLHSTST